MNKTLVLIVILAALGGASYYLTKSNTKENNTLTSTGLKFTVPADDIGRITIERKKGENLDFKRNGDGWIVNDEFTVNPHTMVYLLNTISKMDMQYIPYKESRENIIKDMEKIGIHVTIYDKGDEKLKSFVVGPNSLKGDATYFMLDGDTQPYAMNMNGFDGNIRDRFNYDLENWKDKTVFDIKYDEIEKVTVNYPKKPSISFVITTENGSLEVNPTSQLTPRKNTEANKSKVEAYLNSFENIMAEGFDNKNPKKDSIRNLTSFVEFDILKKDNSHVKYKMIPFRDVLNPDINTRDVMELQEVERYFVSNEVNGDFLVIQQRLFKQLLRPYDYFF